MAAPQEPPLSRAGRAALLHGIYVIVNEGEPDPREIAHAALAAGIRVVQYRAKRGIVNAHLTALRAATWEAGALLIVNDDWRAALAFDCDGVHLGPGDGGFDDIEPVRAALPERLIGLSCGTVAEAKAATRAGADYIGVGAIYETSSKDDAGAPIGLSGLRSVLAATPLPVAAIGGIDAATVGAVRGSGAAMAAVISAIALASDPSEAAVELRTRWESREVAPGSRFGSGS